MDTPKVSISSAKALYNYLLDHGATAEALDAACGLKISQVDPNTDRLVISSYHALWRFALEFTGDPSIGLVLGSLERTESMSLLSHLFFSSDTLGQALELYQRFFGFINESISIALPIRDGLVHIEYHVRDPAYYCVPDMDRTLAIAIHRAQTHIHPVLDLAYVAFQHTPAKTLRDQYEACFPCELRFGEACCCIAFPAHHLDFPLPEASRSLHQVLLQQLESVLEQSSSMHLRVRSLIHKHLDDGLCHSDEIARELCVSRHTLYRKLKENGLTFHEIVDEVRKEKALNLIANSEANLTEIALSLGFSELSAFSRAFKRWTGSNPSRFVRSYQK